VHDQQPPVGIGRQQNAVPGHQCAPVPDRRGQPHVPLAGQAKHALPVRGDEHEPTAFVDVQAGARCPAEGAFRSRMATVEYKDEG
jgi:hypothetical protein